MMTDLKTALTDYGADYGTTMARFLGDEALYLRLLDLFFRDDSVNQLGAALADGDLAAAFAAAHTLKGVSANMGLTPLYEAVCVLVEPLRVQEPRSDYAQRYERVRAEYARAEAMLRSLEGEGR